MHLICLPVQALTLVNILQLSLNLYILFISDIAWTILKMVCMRVMIHLQRHTKVFQYIMAYEEKIFKEYFNMFILQVNFIKLTYVIHTYKCIVSLEKWFK